MLEVGLVAGKKPQFAGFGDGLPSAVDLEFFVDPERVKFHCPGGNKQHFCDLWVAQTLGQEGQDLDLTLRQEGIMSRRLRHHPEFLICEGFQESTEISHGDRLRAQTLQQFRHPRTQVHKEANEATRLCEPYRFICALERSRFIATYVVQHSLKGKHLDQEARVVRGGEEFV